MEKGMSLLTFESTQKAPGGWAAICIFLLLKKQGVSNCDINSTGVIGFD